MSAPHIDITLNGQPHPVPAGSSLRALIEAAGLAGQPVAAEVNREVVPFRKHAERILLPGDRVELVTLVGGG